ncbi:MAG TPA: 2-amino-4-hydroxy-6-hydroxymethyldihydropteridine diphosphokinase [Spirochaetes bacterium]|nr:2-amino-4-hydroxy-6-hydroxymethyldihydropteridine diphosphokinase [Spirochaetota bacterium]
MTGFELKQVYIGLGSNLGDRRAYLDRAVGMITADGAVKLVAQSRVEETDPVDYLDQPRFLNQVIRVETGLSAKELLRRLREVEDALGRRREVPRGPRTIDCDILLYGDEIMADDELTVPHPGIPARDFILDHLLEIDPELEDPLTGKKYRELRHEKNSEH